MLEGFVESSVLMEIAEPFAVSYQGGERKLVPVKLGLRRRKKGKQMRSRVQNFS